MSKEEQYTRLYGAFVAGDYELGTRILFDGGGNVGALIWSYQNAAGRFVYVVDDGSGFPAEIEPNEIIESEKENQA